MNVSQAENATNSSGVVMHRTPKGSGQFLDSFDYFVLVYTPCIWMVGTLSNTLLILVFTQGRSTRNPNIVMFITIAIADILVVTVNLMSQVLRLWAKWCARKEEQQIVELRKSFHPVYVAFATASFLLEPACSEFSIWSECFLSCARLAAICWPHKLRSWVHYRGTVITLIALALFAFFLRVPLYIAHLFSLTSRLAKDVESTDPFFLLFLRFLIPVVVLAVTTHGILLGLRRSREQFNQPNTNRRANATSLEDIKLVAHKNTRISPNHSDAKSVNHEASDSCTRQLRKNVPKCAVPHEDGSNSHGQVSLVRITFVLIGKNVSYFLFVSTYIIVDLLKNFRLISITSTTRDLYLYSYMLASIHHITSFFICLAGGKAFRQETIRIIKRCTTLFRKNSATHSTTEQCDRTVTWRSTA